MKVFELTNAKKSKGSKEAIIKREEEFAKGQLDRVIVTLKDGPKELIARHLELKDMIDKLTEERKNLTTDLKAQIDDLFKAEEKVLTRVIKTAEFSATLSGEYMSGKVTVVDYEAIVEELLTTLTPKALEMLNEIKEKYTKINEAQKVVSSLRTKKEKTKEGLEEDHTVTHRYLKEESFISRMYDWVKKYSKQALENIVSKINAYDLAQERLEIKANLKDHK